MTLIGQTHPTLPLQYGQRAVFSRFWCLHRHSPSAPVSCSLSTPPPLKTQLESGGQVAPEIWPASQPDSGWLDNHFSSFFFPLLSSSHLTSCSHGRLEPARQGEITADPSLWMDQCLVRPLEGQFDWGDLLARPADGPVVSSQAGAGREAGVAGGGTWPLNTVDPPRNPPTHPLSPGSSEDGHDGRQSSSELSSPSCPIISYLFLPNPLASCRLQSGPGV